jgi:protein phosphatase
MYKINVSAYSYKGNFREKNEDNFFVNGVYLPVEHIDDESVCELKTDKQSIFCVFDGLGGESIGEVASGTAAEIMKSYADKDFDFEGYFSYANDKILDLKTERKVRGCGTTAVMARVANGKFCIANIGDSPAYLVRGSGKGRSIKKLHEEHTIFQVMISSGIMTEDELLKGNMKNTLTQCLGIEEELVIKPYVSKEEKLKGGDVILLCSDGLSGSLSEEELKAMLGKGAGDKKTAEKLVKAAVANGARDNVTAIVIAVKGGLLDRLRKR